MNRILTLLWIVSLIAAAFGLIAITFMQDFELEQALSYGTVFYVVLAGMAFVAEFVSTSIGMGYGTILTPVLIIMGFSPVQIVPTVLLSQFVGGVMAGGIHQKLGNVDFRRGTEANKIMWIIAGCAFIGTIAAVFLLISLPNRIVEIYIGVMILAIGLFIILGRRFQGKFSWAKIIGLGSIAAFNKGISGGGYGPLVTGGQILVGVPEKNAIGITALAEGMVCLVGLILFVAIQGGVEWKLALPLLVGSTLSVPFAAWMVKILPDSSLRHSVGHATVFLGVLTLIKVAL